MDELTQEFLVESQEGLDRMERCLTELETRPNDRDLLAEIFRSVHTIKGTTGFLALPRLEKLAHAGEHLLGSLRDGKLKATAPVVDGLLALLDGLRSVLRLIETTGREGTRDGDDDGELIAMLDGLNDCGHESKVRQTRPPSLQSVHTAQEPGARAPQAVDHTLRVDVETLNRMMNLVGELVLTRNQILQTTGVDDQFQGLARRLDGVTADLREAVMRARTQPVGQLFQKFPRMVRDLAQSCARCVRLDFEGQETRLDKSLLEALKDPITHALRNAVDHGIESPGERVRSGKALEGVIKLGAHHEGGQVVIEISDDGGGISKDRVIERAVERGIITAEHGRAMTEQEAFQLVFEPGFSTRDEVTLVSGRGVGMDVVRSNVESVGGVVELESTLGQGTTLRMRVPLTLAIVPALVVRCGGESFAIPQNAVGELLIVQRREEQQLVQKIGDARMLRLRDELLPLVSLNDLLGLGKDDANGYYVAVVEAKGRRFGLIVDDLLDPQEIVVKPLSRVLRGAGVFSGASVLGNGNLALILDIAGVSARARIEVNEMRTSETTLVTEQAKAEKAYSDAGLMLIFENQAGERTALALASVERIERVHRQSVEYCAGAALMQYREGFLPLEDTCGLLQSDEPQTLTVVICRKDASANGRVGLLVRRVLDIAVAEALPDHTAHSGRLALVHNRLATIHQGFDSLQEAA